MSRSITHKVGKNWLMMTQKGINMQEKFLEEVKEVIQTEGYDPYQVINIDQLRFDKEMHGHRTLNIRGPK